MGKEPTKREQLLASIRAATRISHEMLLYGEWVADPVSCYREARVAGELLAQNTHWIPAQRRHYAAQLARECQEAGKGRLVSGLAAAALAWAARRVLEGHLEA